MLGTDWRSVASSLRDRISRATHAQVEFAQRIGFKLDPNTPQIVAAALLVRHLQKPLGIPPSSGASERQLSYLHRLAEETYSPMPRAIADRTVADAWIEVMHAKRAAMALEAMQPEPGDVVQIPPWAGHELRIVASIASDGVLYFRGGFGQRARPHNVLMFARKTDENYDDAVYTARQQAAARFSNPERVSSERVSELEQWKVSALPDLTSCLALEDALGSAADERPLQTVLEDHPEILAYLVTGHHGIYVIPQVMLGRQYVPDFLIAAETSNGLQWTLVEIESPNAALTISDGQHSAQLRKAIQQVIDWKEWLASNIDYARRSAGDGGLGLPGIRADARALIIISRETHPTARGTGRIRELNDRNMEIRTYDWLLRACRQARQFPIGILDKERDHSGDLF